MSRLEAPRGHGDVLDGLWRAALAERLPHALLLEGPAGIGKFMAARYFAAGMFCAQGPGAPCGQCGPCHRMGSGGEESNHPDLLEIDPLSEGEESIRIAHIAYRENDSSKDKVPLRRTVEGFLDLKPQESAARIVILREADRLNANAQNALLKTLEEPREGTLLLLVAERPDALLDTVISRVTRVHFEHLESDVAATLLRGKLPELGEGEARDLVRWAGGSPGRAMRLAREGRPRMGELIGAVLLGRLGPIQASHEVWKVEGDFPGKTERAKERRRGRAVLELALDLVADLGSLAAGARAGSLGHGEWLDGHGLVAQAQAGRLGLVRERLLRARTDLDANLTPGAVVDAALLSLAELAPRSR